MCAYTIRWCFFLVSIITFYVFIEWQIEFSRHDVPKATWLINRLIKKGQKFPFRNPNLLLWSLSHHCHKETLFFHLIKCMHFFCLCSTSQDAALHFPILHLQFPIHKARIQGTLFYCTKLKFLICKGEQKWYLSQFDLTSNFKN